MFNNYGMKSVIILIAALCVAMGSAAKGLTGKVVDENGEPLEFVNVRAMRDSAFVAGQTTDAEGRFRFADLPSTANRVEVAIVGYERQNLPIGASGNMGQITMRPAANTLSEVEVKAERPKTRLSGNALVTSVENTILSTAGSGDDVLQNIPMLQGGDGDYTVFGNDGSATIYINGRQVRNSADIARLSSSDIKEVQVISNPGASYGGGVKGVIKIISKRPVGEGFSLSAYTQNQYNGRYYNVDQLNLKYRTGGLDVFAEGYSHVGQSRWENDQQIWFDNPKSTYSHTITDKGPATNAYFSGKIGANYDINTRHNIGAYYEFTYGNFPQNFKNNSIIMETGIPEEVTTSHNTGGVKDMPFHDVNTYYTGRIGNFTLDANVDYMFHHETSTTLEPEQSNLNPDLTIDTHTIQQNSLFAEKVMATYKLPNGEVTLGEEYTYTRTYNDFKSLGDVLDSENTRLWEQNIGVFINAEYTIGKVGLSAGLRYEHVRSRYFINEVLSEVQSHTYDNLYPSASVTYSPGAFNFTLSYSHRSYRPNYGMLYPEYLYTNRVLYHRGNPNLQPEKRHTLTLQGTWKFITFMAQYANRTDVFVQVFEPYRGNENIQVRTMANKPHNNEFYAFISASPTIGIWNPTLSLSVDKPWFEADYRGSLKKMGQPQFDVKWQNTFTLPWDITAEASLSWSSSHDYLNLHMSSQTRLNLRVYKSFLNKTLTVYLAGYDLLDKTQQHTWYYSGIVHTDGIIDNHNRMGMLTLRYNFNTSRSRYKGTGAGQSEKSRF